MNPVTIRPPNWTPKISRHEVRRINLYRSSVECLLVTLSTPAVPNSFGLPTARSSTVNSSDWRLIFFFDDIQDSLGAERESFELTCGIVGASAGSAFCFLRTGRRTGFEDPSAYMLMHMSGQRSLSFPCIKTPELTAHLLHRLADESASALEPFGVEVKFRGKRPRLNFDNCAKPQIAAEAPQGCHQAQRRTKVQNVWLTVASMSRLALVADYNATLVRGVNAIPRMPPNSRQ